MKGVSPPSTRTLTFSLSCGRDQVISSERIKHRATACNHAQQSQQKHYLDRTNAAPLIDELRLRSSRTCSSLYQRCSAAARCSKISSTISGTGTSHGTGIATGSSNSRDSTDDLHGTEGEVEMQSFLSSKTSNSQNTTTTTIVSSRTPGEGQPSGCLPRRRVYSCL